MAMVDVLDMVACGFMVFLFGFVDPGEHPVPRIDDRGGGEGAPAVSMRYLLVFCESCTLEFLPDTRTYPDISWWSAEQKSVQ